MEYHTPNDKGVSKAQYFTQVGLNVEQPQVNPIAEYLLELFWELSSGRTTGGFGATRLTWLDINAWSNMTGVVLTPWELGAIRKMDAVFVTAANKKA